MMRHTVIYKRNGQYPLGVARFSLFFLFLSHALLSLADESALKEITQLAKGGASELALSMLQQQQPEYIQDPAQWMRWERVRVKLMQQREQWSELVEHLSQLSAELPADFQDWVKTRQANALIFTDHTIEARQLLRDLIWSGLDTNSQMLAQWRQLVMQSYLREGRTDDAYVAMLRYQQDYGEGDSDALLMRVRILLASSHPAEARSLLETLPHGRTNDLLAMLARLRTGESAKGILKQLQAEKKLKEFSPLQRYLYYGIMAEAAKTAIQPIYVSLALEQWLAIKSPTNEWRELFPMNPDLLWQSYLDYAQSKGNAKQLLIGDDEAWFKLAEKTSKRYPVSKRALYAQVSQKALSESFREKAAVALIESLQKMDDGILVAEQLFLDSSRYDEKNPIPAGAAYILVDHSIHDGKLLQAARLMRQLPEPPEDTAKFPWQLRRIKVFILSGENDAAVELLRLLIPGAASLTKTRRDQLLQLLFDLQTVGEHNAAFTLLDELYKSVPNLNLRRELLFWMADSRVAQGNYAEAAQLYLRSATLIDLESMDPWAQTARFKAAETLARGDMLADAATIYKRLLKVTKEKDRRAILLRELEQIRMRQAANAKH